MSSRRTFTFHGIGRNLVAICTFAARSGSAASNWPMMRSLSPSPYTSAVSKKVAPASIDASHASRMVPSLRAVS